MKNLKTLTIASIMLIPALGLAQSNGNLSNLFGLINSAQNLVNTLIGFVIALATLVFIWGLLTYLVSGEEDKKKEAKSHMVWGIIGLFVMVSVWGLVGFLQSALFGSGGTATSPKDIPSVGTLRN
jgi:uncharacterized membrane protein YidH (DUF202 family)